MDEDGKGCILVVVLVLFVSLCGAAALIIYFAVAVAQSFAEQVVQQSLTALSQSLQALMFLQIHFTELVKYLMMPLVPILRVLA